jgi:diguanylate cyclase (GGDEF)-like protein
MALHRVYGLWRSIGVIPRVFAIAAILVVIVVAVRGMALVQFWETTAADAQGNASKLSIVLAEQAARSLQAADLVLRGTERMLNEEGATTPDDFIRIVGSRAFYDRDLSRIKELPQVGALSAVSVDGRLVHSSRRWPAPDLLLTHRDFWKYCQAPQHGELFISGSAASFSGKRPVFYLARCASAPDGQLIGVLLAAIKIDYLTDFYRSIGLRPGTSVAIQRQDGRTLFRFPVAADDEPALPAMDERSYFLARTPVTAYPLVLQTGIPRRCAVTIWLHQALWVLLGSIVTIGFMLGLTQMLVTMIRRFERAQQALLDRNAALSAAHSRLKGQSAALARTAEALRESEARLSKQSEVLETTLQHMDQGLMMVTAERVVAVCNRRAMEMLDLPSSLMASRPSFSEVLAYQRGMDEFSDASGDIKQFVRAGGLLDQPHTYERKRPNGRVLEVRSIPLAGGGLVRTYTDVTDRKQAEDRLTFLAYHDELTGLLNRRALHQALREATQAAGTQSTPGLAVLYLDLDRFKLVNDTRGHAVGDALLVQVAQRLRRVLRDEDVLARLGGDEFAVLLTKGVDRNVALAFSERLRETLNEPFHLDGEVCRIGVSVGIALHRQDGATVDALLRSADSALYRAKAAGRNVACFHESEQEQEQIGRLVLEQDLRAALDLEQFELVYQPIFNIETGLPASMEALVRWRHPTLGLLSPEKFIPVAEETGVIHELGRWVMQTACKEAATWALPVRVAINLSSVQFLRQDLEAQVAAVLQSSGLTPDRLDLEVTETVLITEADTVRQTMLSLQQRGVRMVMDDFGTGHSSLKTLETFPFQQIKIDRAFVAKVDDESGAGAIIRAVLTMAQTMKLEVVAEGVENTGQRDMLRRMGCRYMQGYLLQEPRSPEWTRDLLWRAQTQKLGESIVAIA